jgi:N-acetylglucosaminyldiphosphoundecaprenol N-acetyl-beta-D-mannosaminyltransferase
MTTAATPPSRRRATLLGCDIDRVDLDATVERCDRLISERGYGQHMAINAAKLVAMQDDPDLRAITGGCELVTADGQAVVWASRLLGDPLPERVAGIDLMIALLALAEEKHYSIYILGARQEVLEDAVAAIRGWHPWLQIAGHRDGYFDPRDDAAVAAEIRRAAPDMLFVAMSSPRKEYFLGRYRDALGVPFVMGVGGSVDVIAGRVRRAPRVMQRVGLEWLFRAAQEPRRLGPRYATTNARFAYLIARELLAGGRDAEPRPPRSRRFSRAARDGEATVAGRTE